MGYIYHLIVIKTSHTAIKMKSDSDIMKNVI